MLKFSGNPGQKWLNGFFIRINRRVSLACVFVSAL
jgi:hypothetical protein